MKKIWKYLFVLLSLASYGQKQKEYKWGCSFAINSMEAQIGVPEESSWGYVPSNFRNYGDRTNHSLSLSIIPKYSISDDMLLRFEFGISNINLKGYFDSQLHDSFYPETSRNIITQTIEQKIYRYMPGIQWIFFKKKIVESYCGLNVSYSHYNNMNYSDIIEDKSLPDDTLIVSIVDNASAKGGYSYGVGAFAGFNVYPIKHFSIGAEFSSSLLYYKLGGGFNGVVVNQTIPKPPTIEIYSYSTTSYKGIQFSKIISSLNISISF